MISFRCQLIRGLRTAAVAGFFSLAFMSAPADGRPFQTGASTIDTGLVQPRLGMDRLKAVGGSYVRLIFYWSSIAPANKPVRWDPEDPSDPNYDWSVVDANVSNAVAAGLTPVVMVYSAPKWAERCSYKLPGICNPDPEMFEDFSKAAAVRFNGSQSNLPRVRFWQAWNEPNLHLFFQPQLSGSKTLSPDLYRELLNHFATAVKAADPGNKVIAGGLAPLDRPGGIGPLHFMRRLFCLKGRNKPKPVKKCKAATQFDIWATHPYTTGGPNHHAAGADDVSLPDLPKVRVVLEAARKAGRIKSDTKNIPMWITEFSWDSKPSDPGGVPMGTLRRWMAEAMYRAWKIGINQFFWLTLRDWRRESGTPWSQTIDAGLFFRGTTLESDRPKAIVQSFRFPFVSFRERKGIRVWGRTPDSTAGKVVFHYRLSGKWRRIGDARANRSGVFYKMIRTSIGKDRRGIVRAIFKGETAVPFSLKPTRDHYQPPFG